jgi:urease accessory protein
MVMMLRINRIIGSRLDQAFHDRLHRLERRNAVDEVQLSVDDLERRHFATRTRRGQELVIALPRHQRLFDGAVLLLDESQAIVVRTMGQRWLRLEPRSIGDAVELGYQIGHLGWPVRFEGEVLFVELRGRPENYMVRLGDLIWSRRVGMSVIDAGANDGVSPR